MTYTPTYMLFAYSLKVKVEQPDALQQHNEMTNYETEIFMWKYVSERSFVGSGLP